MQAILKDPLEAILRDEDAIGITGAPRPSIQRHRQASEMPGGRLRRDGTLEHRIEQPPLAQHFRRARVDPTAPGLATRCGLLLDHLDADTGQPQFSGQHQPSRAGTDNDHIGLCRVARLGHTDNSRATTAQRFCTRA